MRGGTEVTGADLQEEPSERGVRRFWVLALKCGHTVRRPVTYTRLPTSPYTRHRRPRARADVKPAQTHAYCDRCPPAPRPLEEPTKIRVRASARRAAQVVELLRTVAPDLIVYGPRFRTGGFVDYYCETRTVPAQPGQEGAEPRG